MEEYFKLLSALVIPEDKEYITILYGNAWEFQFHDPRGLLYEVQQTQQEPVQEIIKRFLVKVKHYKLTKEQTK